jgi:hypothetical protein
MAPPPTEGLKMAWTAPSSHGSVHASVVPTPSRDRRERWFFKQPPYFAGEPGFCFCRSHSLRNVSSRSAT